MGFPPIPNNNIPNNTIPNNTTPNNTASRKRSSSASIRVSDPHTAAVKSLECTACKCTPTRGRTTYYTCDDGHVVCQMCGRFGGKNKKRLCPTCHGVGKRLKLNPFVGRLADRVTQPRTTSPTPSPASTKGIDRPEPRPMPAGLECLKRLFSDPDLIRDRDLETAKIINRKLRQLLDDVHGYLRSYMGKETLDANAREFALRKMARDRKIEWIPRDCGDVSALIKRLLNDKDRIFEYLRLYEFYIGNAFSKREMHYKPVVEIVHRQDLDGLIAYIQRHCGLTLAAARKLCLTNCRSNISVEPDVVQGSQGLCDIIR